MKRRKPPQPRPRDSDRRKRSASALRPRKKPPGYNKKLRKPRREGESRKRRLSRRESD